MSAGGGDRRRGRELAVQALFSLEAVAPAELRGLLARVWDTVDDPGPEVARGFAEELVRGVVEQREFLDEAIQLQSTAWRVDRMAKVDRNILRVASFELLKLGTPAKVVINEAVEIARTFGAEGSSAFVNGVLDKVARAAGLL